jgi:hypothetical protein
MQPVVAPRRLTRPERVLYGRVPPLPRCGGEKTALSRRTPATEVLKAQRGYVASNAGEGLPRLLGNPFEPPTQWVTWFYSPLNLRYWAMAMLFFSPALGCWLLARGLA